MHWFVFTLNIRFSYTFSFRTAGILKDLHIVDHYIYGVHCRKLTCFFIHLIMSFYLSALTSDEQMFLFKYMAGNCQHIPELMRNIRTNLPKFIVAPQSHFHICFYWNRYIFHCPTALHIWSQHGLLYVHSQLHLSRSVPCTLQAYCPLWIFTLVGLCPEVLLSAIQIFVFFCCPFFSWKVHFHFKESSNVTI